MKELTPEGSEGAKAYSEELERRVRWTISDIDRQIECLRARKATCEDIIASIENVRKDAEKGFI